MDRHVRDCLVEHFEDLIPALHLPDDNDRHVLAAAIRGRADVIVTYNLKDFPEEEIQKYGIAAQHPDEFLTHMLDLAPGTVCAAAQTHRKRLRNPGKTVDQYLETLERQALNAFVAGLRAFAALANTTRPSKEPPLESSMRKGASGASASTSKRVSA